MHAQSCASSVYDAGEAPALQVPEDAIRRRFKTELDNFRRIYRPLAGAWVLYDNSGAQPVLLEWGETE